MIGHTRVQRGLYLLQCYLDDGKFKKTFENQLVSLLSKNFDSSFVSCNTTSVSHCNSALSTFDLWHFRLGHVSFDKIKQIAKQCTNVNCVENLFCHVYPLAKQKRLPFPTHVKSTNVAVDLIHTDIWGLYKTSSVDGYHYFLAIVDEFTRFAWVFLIKFKYEVANILTFFITWFLRKFLLK